MRCKTVNCVYFKCSKSFTIYCRSRRRNRWHYIYPFNMTLHTQCYRVLQALITIIITVD